MRTEETGLVLWQENVKPQNSTECRKGEKGSEEMDGGTGVWVSGLRALVALAEDLALVLRTQMVVHKHLELQFQRY